MTRCARLLRQLRRLGVAAAALWVAAGAALAQDRSPAQRQALADLAYVLGESHALRQVCDGPGDQFWRGRMQRMIAAEAPDPAFDARLKQAFNTGYAAAQATYPTCDETSRRAAERVAQRGRVLAGAAAQ